MKKRINRRDEYHELAREMRRCPTKAEEILWAALRGRKIAGLKFRRQSVIGQFIADFYCAAARLVVEVDGDIHDGQKEYDDTRTRQFEEHGYRVIRFHNEIVIHELERVLLQIEHAALDQE